MKYKLIVTVMILVSSTAYAQNLLLFNKIKLAAQSIVEVSQGEAAAINLQGAVPGNATSYYHITNDGWLIIDGNPDQKIAVTAPSLKMIEISGNGKLTLEAFKADSITLLLSGIGKMELNLSAVMVNAIISGAGKIELSGSAEEMVIDISGAGKIDGENFKVKKCTANISGSGKSLIDVSDELTSNISGSGSIYYVKAPLKIYNNVTGIGKIGDANTNSRDTTKIMIGKRKILIIDGDNRNVRLSFKDSTHSIKDKKVKSHWAGFELGINTLVDKDFSSNLPGRYDYLNLREEKSIAVNFNLVDYQLKLYRRNIMLVTGLGFSYNNYRFKSDSYLAPNVNQLSAITDSLNLKKNKLVVSYVNVPLLIEFNTSSSPKKTVHLATGVIAGVKIDSHVKVIREIGNNETKSKIYDDFNLNPFRLDATVRLGFRNMTIFGSYGLVSLFKENKGPEISPLTVGLRLIGW
jgi:hypothetical protein